MATGNFLSNTNKIYAVLLGHYEDDEYYPPEDWDMHDLISEVKDHLAEKIDGDFHTGGEDDRDRNYYGSCIGTYIKSRSYLGVDIEVVIRLYLRSAYYEGANLDYRVEYNIDGSAYDHRDDALYYWEGAASDTYKGLAKAHFHKVWDWFEATAAGMEEAVDEVFTAHSEQVLTLVGTFSNGEQIYKAV